MSLGSRYTCADNVRRVAVFYGSTGTVDDQAWGALWLHKATRDQSWLDKVRPWRYGSACYSADMPGWADLTSTTWSGGRPQTCCTRASMPPTSGLGTSGANRPHM